MAQKISVFRNKCLLTRVVSGITQHVLLSTYHLEHNKINETFISGVEVIEDIPDFNRGYMLAGDGKTFRFPESRLRIYVDELFSKGHLVSEVDNFTAQKCSTSYVKLGDTGKVAWIGTLHTESDMKSFAGLSISKATRKKEVKSNEKKPVNAPKQADQKGKEKNPKDAGNQKPQGGKAALVEKKTPQIPHLDWSEECTKDAAPEHSRKEPSQLRVMPNRDRFLSWVQFNAETSVKASAKEFPDLKPLQCDIKAVSDEELGSTISIEGLAGTFVDFLFRLVDGKALFYKGFRLTDRRTINASSEVHWLILE